MNVFYATAVFAVTEALCFCIVRRNFCPFRLLSLVIYFASQEY